MEISAVRFSLPQEVIGETTVLAYCSAEVDKSWVIHDIRIILRQGRLFVSMPNRRTQTKCIYCRAGNSTSANYCSQCGKEVSHQPSQHQRNSLFRDIVHPTNAQTRQYVEQRIFEELGRKLDCSEDVPAEYPRNSILKTLRQYQLNAVSH